MVKLLIDNGANFKNDKDLYWTPLDFALSNQRNDIINFLIAKGAYVPENAVAVLAFSFFRTKKNITPDIV